MAGIKGKGGVKGRSGRKPSKFTELRRRIESERVDDADYAFALYAEVMRDATEPLELRLSCADWIANRVLGKPKERLEHSGDKDAPMTFNHGIIATLLAPRPSGNHSE